MKTLFKKIKQNLLIGVLLAIGWTKATIRLREGDLLPVAHEGSREVLQVNRQQPFPNVEETEVQKALKELGPLEEEQTWAQIGQLSGGLRNQVCKVIWFEIHRSEPPMNRNGEYSRRFSDGSPDYWRYWLLQKGNLPLIEDLLAPRRLQVRASGRKIT